MSNGTGYGKVGGMCSRVCFLIRSESRGQGHSTTLLIPMVLLRRKE